MNPGFLSKLKIGVLVPSSSFVPFLASDMLTAFESGLARSHLDAEIIIESAGYNADVKMIVPAIQRLILSKRVNCLVAPFNVAVIESIAGYCENQGVPLIALNLTEDPLFETARNPSVFVNSFFLWHSAWMTGYAAARKFGKKAAGIAAIHDGGYGLMFAFQLGLEAAGGNLLQSAVTHRTSSTEKPSDNIAQIAATEPDFICAAYSGKEAVSFFKAFESSGLKNKIPLVALSPAVGENIRQGAGDDLRGVHYLSEEFPAAPTEEDSLAAALGRKPNPYAVLVYEAAHLIADAVTQTNEKNFAANFPDALWQAKFESFRGRVEFNADLKPDTQFCLRQINDSDEIIEKLTAPPLLHEQYALACRKLTKQGWLNPYLCG